MDIDHHTTPTYYEQIEERIQSTIEIKADVEHPKLLLYSRSTCPYCQKVTNYLKSINKKISTKDIGKDSSAAKDLVRIGGKKQVPCLVINGKALYESNDIINWLKENQSKY